MDGLYAKLTRNISALDSTSDVASSTRVTGNVYTSRGPTVDLKAVLDAATTALPNTLNEVQVYADVITASGNIITPASCRIIKIFARVLFPGATEANRVNIALQSTHSVVLVYASTNMPDVPAVITWPGKVANQTLSFAKNGGRFSMSVAQNVDIVVHAASPPRSSFIYMSPTEMILDHGKVSDLGFDKCNDHLPKLLTFQMLLAESLLQSQPATSFNIAIFVASITANIPEALDFHSQATAFLAGRIAGDNSTVQQQIVANIDVSSAKSILQSRLAAAEAFETAFQQFASQATLDHDIQVLAHAALDGADIAARAYAFLADEAKGTFDRATSALKIAQERFQEIQTRMPAAQQKFKDGLEEWKKKEIAKAVVEGIILLVTVVGTIAAAVVFPPAGTALVAEGGAVLGVIKVVGDETQQLTTIAMIINKMKDLFEIMRPALEKIDKMVESVFTVMELLEKFKATGAADDALSTTTTIVAPGEDTINMSAQWDIFANDMDGVFNPLQDFLIGGADEFHSMLGDMSILGKAVLSAQLAVTGAAAAYTTALTQSAMADAQSANMRTAITKLTGDPLALGIWQRAMFDQLCRLRAWIFMDMSSFAEAYRWFALDQQIPVVLDPMKPIAEMLQDAATIEAKAIQAAYKLEPQTLTLVLDSTDVTGPLDLGTVGTSWQQTLSQTRAFRFGIQPRHAIFKPFFRLRVRSMLVVLFGAHGASTQTPVYLTITRSQSMIDLREADQTSSSETSDVSTGGSKAVHSLVAVVGSSQRMGCAYIPSKDLSGANRVLMSGEMANGAISATQQSSLFAEWLVSVGDGVNIDAVTGFSVEVLCDVSML